MNFIAMLFYNVCIQINKMQIKYKIQNQQKWN